LKYLHEHIKSVCPFGGNMPSRVAPKTVSSADKTRQRLRGTVAPKLSLNPDKNSKDEQFRRNSFFIS
jgi:hypothetical protein